MHNIFLKNITVTKQNKTILKDISIDLKGNESVIIKGTSGSGKSTLLKCLLLFEDIGSGKIYFDGKPVDETNVYEYRKNFSYISQKLPYFYGKVEDFLNLPNTFKGNKNLSISQNRINYFFGMLSLNVELISKEYNKLSDGEKQRVCIVQALLLERDFIVLDEVTSNLDTKNKNNVVHIMSALKKTVIAVSHDDCWDNFKARRIDFENGKIKNDQPIEEL